MELECQDHVVHTSLQESQHLTKAKKFAAKQASNIANTDASVINLVARYYLNTTEQCSQDMGKVFVVKSICQCSIVIVSTEFSTAQHRSESMTLVHVFGGIAAYWGPEQGIPSTP